jgi:hypothetical protein
MLEIKDSEGEIELRSVPIASACAEGACEEGGCEEGGYVREEGACGCVRDSSRCDSTTHLEAPCDLVANLPTLQSTHCEVTTPSMPQAALSEARQLYLPEGHGKH